MYKEDEININKELNKQRNYEILLIELRKKRKFALAGTIGGVALICTNMQLTSDVNFALATMGVVSLPHISSYFCTIKNIKKRMWKAYRGLMWTQNKSKFKTIR